MVLFKISNLRFDIPIRANPRYPRPCLLAVVSRQSLGMAEML